MWLVWHQVAGRVPDKKNKVLQHSIITVQTLNLGTVPVVLSTKQRKRYNDDNDDNDNIYPSLDWTPGLIIKTPKDLIGHHHT